MDNVTSHGIEPVGRLILGATLANTLGAYQIGVAISLFLFGIASLQAYYYYEHYESDAFEVKAAVAFIWLLELAHTILIVETQYHFTATTAGYGTYLFMKDFPATAKVSFLCSGVMATIFSTYCAYRIKLIMKNWGLPLFFMICAAARLGLTVAIVVLLLKKGVIGVLSTNKNVAVAALGLGFVLDLVISVVLTILLIRSPGNFPRGERSVKRLTLFSIESGFVSFLLGIPMVVTVAGNTFNFVWLAFVFIIAKVNSNSILVTLNSRHALANSYATPSRNSLRLKNAFAFHNKSDGLSITTAQVTVSAEESQSFGHDTDYSIRKGGLNYPPTFLP